RAFGISFLAMPRSTHAADAREAPPGMRAAGWLLAAACVVLGIAAPLVVPALYGVLSSIGGLAPEAVTPPAASLWIGAGTTLGWLSPPLLALLAAVVVVATFFAVRAVHRRPIRNVDTWGCGRIAQTPRMEYTASAFAEPLRRVFAELYRPTQDLTVDLHPDSPYFVESITFTSEVRPWFEQAIYDPIVRAARGIAARVRRLQS